MPINPEIALQVKPIDIENPLNQFAKLQQVKQLQQSNALNELQTQELQKEITNKNAMRHYLTSNSNIDGEGFTSNLITKFGKSGAELAKLIHEQKVAEMNEQKLKGELIDQSLKRVKGEYEGVRTPEELLEVEKRNFEDPTLGPYLTSRGLTYDITKKHIEDAVKAPGGFDKLLREVKLGVEKAAEQHYISQNGGGFERVISQPKYNTGTEPATSTEVPGSRITVTKSPNATQTTINVGGKTATEYGKKFAGKVADQDAALFDNVGKAESIAETSNEIQEILAKGNVITGTGAKARLQLAKALNLAGADNTEKIKNTEKLTSNIAKSTLNVVKTSGLGTGQGFSDKDLNFLQDVAGGRIEMSAENLKYLADLQYRSAVRTVEMFNKRSKQLPTEVVSELGLDISDRPIPKSYNPPKVGEIIKGHSYLGGDPSKSTSWKEVK